MINEQKSHPVIRPLLVRSDPPGRRTRLPLLISSMSRSILLIWFSAPFRRRMAPQAWNCVVLSASRKKEAGNPQIISWIGKPILSTDPKPPAGLFCIEEKAFFSPVQHGPPPSGRRPPSHSLRPFGNIPPRYACGLWSKREREEAVETCKYTAREGFRIARSRKEDLRERALEGSYIYVFGVLLTEGALSRSPFWSCWLVGSLGAGKGFIVVEKEGKRAD